MTHVHTVLLERETTLPHKRVSLSCFAETIGAPNVFLETASALSARCTLSLRKLQAEARGRGAQDTLLSAESRAWPWVAGADGKEITKLLKRQIF